MSSTQLHQIVILTPTASENPESHELHFFDRVFSGIRLHMVQGFDLSSDSMYVTSAYMGQSIVRLNRTNGGFIDRFEDASLLRPTDVKLFKGHLFVCSNDEVRRYEAYNGEFKSVHIQHTGAQFSTMLFHSSWTSQHSSQN